MASEGFTYILARTPNGPLQVGATDDLMRSLREHRNGTDADLAEEHDVPSLLHFERFDRMEEAIRREKQLKAWKRDSMLELVQEYNPGWRDLYVEACRTYGP